MNTTKFGLYTANGSQRLGMRGLRAVCCMSKVRFQTTRRVPPGNIHKVVGDHASLGAWNPDSAPSMERSQGHVWTTTVEIPAGTTIDFKCIELCQNSVIFEEGIMRRVKVEDTEELRTDFAWEQTELLTYDTGARYKKLSFLVPTEELKRPFRKVNLTDILKSDVLAFLSLHNAEWVGPPGVEQPSEMDEYSLGALREYDFEDVLNGWQNAMIDGMENAAAERSVTSLKEARHTAVQRYGGPKIVRRPGGKEKWVEVDGAARTKNCRKVVGIQSTLDECRQP